MKKNGFVLILILLVLLVGVVFIISRNRGLFSSKVVEQKIVISLVEGDGGTLLQFSYPNNQLQASSPQCEPGKNNQGLSAMECEYLLVNTKPIILFVSYYKDASFIQIEDYKKYLIQNNLAKDIKDVNLGNKSNPINAILYTPLSPDKERKGTIQEYALIKNESLFLIDLKDNTDASAQLFNQVVSTIIFTK